MESPLLQKEVQDFIFQNLGKKSSQIALQKKPFPEIDWATILNQIDAKTKVKDKLPTFFENINVLYPNKISIEQTSSEITANFKSKIVNGDTLVDLTGGFGVDDYYFCNVMKHVIHCELNEELSDIAKHNFNELSKTNCTFYKGDGNCFLENSSAQYDWLYIDPSRRSESKGKVFMLEDCLPNVPELLPFYFTKTSNILIKTAPILDLAAGISELRNVKNIYIVAIKNEVKEILWELNNYYEGPISIKTLNIGKEKTDFFDFVMHATSKNILFSEPKKYVFEPNSSIMKSGGFSNVAQVFNLEKLHQHSHLYTSDALVAFPGRTFQVHKWFVYQKKEMKQHLYQSKANVTTRNFPETVAQIRNKWKIEDGGNVFCFFTTGPNNDKIVLICTKI